MKRFIRTKDGKIIDLSKYENLKEDDCSYYIINKDYRPHSKVIVKAFRYKVRYEKRDIIKQADTIEELIEVGDLVRGIIKCEYSSKKTNYIEKLIELIHPSVIGRLHEITELYTKQGNDYILVAKKENGEWRVI